MLPACGVRDLKKRACEMGPWKDSGCRKPTGATLRQRTAGMNPAARFLCDYWGVGSMMTSFSANVALPLLPSMR